MHDLIPLSTALPGALTTAEIDATMAYAEAEKALATREAYASDWRLRRLVRLQGRHSPACAPGDRRRLPARARRHRPQCQHHRSEGRGDRLPPQDGGHEPPTGSEAVKAVLRGIRRTIGSRQAGARRRPQRI
jgi:hypothetical protein